MNESHDIQNKLEFLSSNHVPEILHSAAHSWIQFLWTEVAIWGWCYFGGWGVEKIAILVITFTREAGTHEVISADFVRVCQIAFRTLYAMFAVVEVADIAIWFSNRGVSQILKMISMWFGGLCILPGMVLFASALMNSTLAYVVLAIDVICIVIVFRFRYMSVLNNQRLSFQKKITKYIGIFFSIGIPIEIGIMIVHGEKFYAILIIMALPFAALGMALYLTTMIATYCAIFKDMLPNQEAYRIGLNISESDWYRKRAA